MRLPRPRTPARGGPLAHAVHRENGRFFVRGRIEGARGVGFVVLGEDETLLELAAEAPAELLRQVELLPEPRAAWPCRKDRKPLGA